MPAPTVRPELLEAVRLGLANGSLGQIGGVIRKLRPRPERGRIFAHLRQAGEAPVHHAVNWGPKLAKGMQLANGLAAATTALSVVNLGVSVVGFAILAKKINRLQASVSALDATVRNGFAAVETRLDRIETKLAGLTTLVHHGQQSLAVRLDDVQTQIDWAQVAHLYAACEGLADLERGRSAGHRADQYAEQIRVVRTYCFGVLTGAGWAASESWDGHALRSRSIAMAYLQAVSAEARAWRMANETDTATRVLHEAVLAWRPLLRDWTEWSLGGQPELLGAAPLGTAAMAPAIGVSRLLLGDAHALSHELDVEFGDRWADALIRDPAKARAWGRSPDSVQQRVYVTRDLMGPLVEATDVLDGLASEYQQLGAQNRSWREWEADQRSTDRPTLFVYDAA